MSPYATIPVTASLDDYWVQRPSATNEYPPTGTTAYVNGGAVLQAGRSLNAGVYYVSVILVRFNTGLYLPSNARVLQARLGFYVENVWSENAEQLYFVGEYFTLTNSTADWTSTAPSTPVLSKAMSGTSQTAFQEFGITDLSGISTTGYTGFRVHVSNKASDAAPTGNNYMNCSEYEDTGAVIPYLVVTYSIWQTSYTRPTEVGKKKRTQALVI